MAQQALKLDDSAAAHRLTQRDLHHRIQDLAEEVLSREEPVAGHPMRPRLISAADLVRRMKPYLVYN